MPGHTKCCTCHAKSSQQTWRSDAPKCNPSQEIRTSLMNMSFVLRLPEKLEERRSEKRKSQKKEDADADARKGRKVAKHCVFPMVWGSGGSKSRLAKVAGAEPAGGCGASGPDERWKGARHCGAKQNVKNTSASDHFWKLRCRKSARRCGSKHISKSKCTKHTSVRPLLGLLCFSSVHIVGSLTSKLPSIIYPHNLHKCTPSWLFRIWKILLKGNLAGWDDNLERRCWWRWCVWWFEEGYGYVFLCTL